MNRWSLLALSAAAGLSASAARADERPLAGDVVNGARVYRQHCAACHGLTGDGDGPLAPGLKPAPPSLRNGSYFWSRTQEQILGTILTGNGLSATAPAHGRGLNVLEARDILVWLKGSLPEVGSFFPAASEYIGHKQVLDEYGVERAEKAIGAPLTEAEKSVMMFTLFQPESGANTTPGVATKIPDEPATLYAAKPKRKVGFVSFQSVQLEGETLQVAFALNRNMKLTAVQVVPSGDDKSEKVRGKYESLLKSYVGSGGRDDKKPVEPQKGPKAPKDVQKAMEKAFTLTLEGAAMYEKEERDRFWADPDAFKMPAAAEMPEDVKFDFKEKKKK
jgi:mono/diheme cytochrome c family protein